MSTGKARPAEPDPERLLQSARSTALRACSTAALRKIVAQLETACETARVIALRNLAQPRQAGETDRTQGFAGLYAALRRARVELGRRETAHKEPSLVQPRAGRRPPVSLRAASRQQKLPLSHALA